MSKFVFFPELSLSINLDNIDEIKIEKPSGGTFLTFIRYIDNGSPIKVKMVKVNNDAEADSFMKYAYGRTEGFIFHPEKPSDSVPEVMIIGDKR